MTEDSEKRLSLRVAELTIQNFRTFRERTVIPLSGGAGATDVIATFHGENASGKSNAIAALDLLFRTLAAQGPGLWHVDSYDPIFSRRNRPINGDHSMEISASFEDSRLGTMKLVVNSSLQVAVGWTKEGWDWLLSPSARKGDTTRRPMAILNAGRRASWFDDQAVGDAIQPALAEALFAARISREPERRALWRDFLAALAVVPSFAGKDISIDRPQKDGLPELTFEERGKSVLGLEELSSGERQLVVLFAGVLLSEAAIVAIEEPELSLDSQSQHLFRDFLQRLVELGRIDQAIIESHVAAFDGPHVVRFHRAASGATTVSRAPSETEEQALIAERAKEQNAQRQWVTRDGYTELPEMMRKDLGLAQGGGLWFLKRDRWEAWPDPDIADFLGGEAPEKNDHG